MLLSFFSLRMWNDVDTLKKKSVTAETFEKEMLALKASIESNKLEAKIDRDKRAEENTGQFRRLEDLIHAKHEAWEQDYRHINGTLTTIQITQAAQGTSLALERRRRDGSVAAET